MQRNEAKIYEISKIIQKYNKCKKYSNITLLVMVIYVFLFTSYISNCSRKNLNLYEYIQSSLYVLLLLLNTRNYYTYTIYIYIYIYMHK